MNDKNLKYKILYKMFIKQYKIYEVLSYLVLGILGNLIVNKVNFFFVWSLSFYKFINYKLIFQIAILFGLSIKLNDFNMLLSKFNSKIIDRYINNNSGFTSIDDYAILVVNKNENKEVELIYRYLRIFISIFLTLIIISIL